ncbi:MAG: hypothetical protein WC006_00115 [Bacilli bacterium]
MFKNYKEPNFWIRGKLEQRKFYDIKLNTKTSIITFIAGLLFGAVIILPFGLMLFQFIMIFGYNLSIFVLYLTIIWILMMLFNGFSNYFTVKLAQAYNKDMNTLQELEPRYIFFYQILNFGFGLFSLFIIVFFGIQLINR